MGQQDAEIGLVGVAGVVDGDLPIPRVRRGVSKQVGPPAIRRPRLFLICLAG